MKKKLSLLFFAFLATFGTFVVFVLPSLSKDIVIDGSRVIVKLTPEPGQNRSEYNIILISIDTLRADYMGCYGYDKKTTPNIDKFAKESIFFENAYSQAPATMPALRSIMTGRVISNESKDDIVSYYENTTYLAEILRKRGYLIVGFTDHYALGNKNENDGFNIYHAHTLVRGFDSFQNFGKNVIEVTSHVLTEVVVDWLEKSYKKKFFLWVHYFDPHFNFNPLPEYEKLFAQPEQNCGRIYNGIDIYDIRKIEKTMTTEEISCLSCLYDAEIFYTDKHIGLVLDKIKELGLSDNTVIIITADHGEEFKERTRIGHERTVYNELIHVPLIIKIPGQAPGVINNNIATKEIFDILSTLSSNKAVEFCYRDVISRTYHYYKGGKTESNDFTIISGSYKYIHNPKTEKEELYNLQDDKREKSNLIWKFRYRGKKRELKRELKSWLDKNSVNVTAPSKEALKSEEGLDRRLRSLGYVR